MTTLRVPDEHAGKQARCPSCQNVLAVPDRSSSPQYTAAPTQPAKPVQFGSAPNPYAGTMPSGAQPQRSYSPHRGGLILTMGILALVCNFFCIPGILAWVMGSGDLKQINAGAMDPEGKGLTQAGMIMGMIGTGMAALVVLVWIAYFVFFLIVVAAGVAGAG